MTREYKFVPLTEFKAIDDGSGRLVGYLSKFNIRDDGGDIVLPGAYTETLPDFIKSGFFALNHDWDKLPIGFVDVAREDDTGLWTEFVYHSTDEAQAARTVAKERIAAGKSVGLSIGYEVAPGGARMDQGTRYLAKLGLFEGSQVNVPMLREATATAVKGALNDMKIEMDGAHVDALVAQQISKAERKWMPYMEPASSLHSMFFGGEPLEGSYEDITEDIEDALNAQRMGMPWSGGYSMVCVLATYPDYAIAVTWGDDGDPDAPVYWNVPYTLDADGDPVLGAPTEVTITFTPASEPGGVSYMSNAVRILTAMHKFTKRSQIRRDVRAKEGRVLSSANHGKLSRLRDALGEMQKELDALLASVEQEKAISVDDLWLDFQRIESRRFGVAVA